MMLPGPEISGRQNDIGEMLRSGSGPETPGRREGLMDRGAAHGPIAACADLRKATVTDSG